MDLLRRGQPVEDAWLDVSGLDASGLEEWPAAGAIIVGLGQWRTHREALLARADPVGLRLPNDADVTSLAGDLHRIPLLALEFPSFRDGRALSQARLLRERLGFHGELRAVGDVLPEQLPLLDRCGFDSYPVQAGDPVAAWAAVTGARSVWYQATGDGRPRAMDLRQRR